MTIRPRWRRRRSRSSAIPTRRARWPEGEEAKVFDTRGRASAGGGGGSVRVKGACRDVSTGGGGGRWGGGGGDGRKGKGRSSWIRVAARPRGVGAGLCV